MHTLTIGVECPKALPCLKVFLKVRPLNLGGESAPGIFRGCGLTGCEALRSPAFLGESIQAPAKVSARSGPDLREEHSVDRCRCRPQLSERFGSHWSILISVEIRMDQSLGALFLRRICMDLRWQPDGSAIRRKPLIFITFERLARIASNLRFAICSCPKTRFAENGIQFRNPQAIRENQANLRIDLRESGHLRYGHWNLRERKKHPKKSDTKIYFCTPLPPSKFFAFVFSYISKGKTARTQITSGR